MKHMGAFDDISPGRTVRGGTALSCRIWHIVISPKGSIPQDPELGWGLPLKLGKKVNETSLKTEAALGREEIKKDRELRDADVTITQLSEGKYLVRIVGFPTNGAAIEINQELQGLA